MNKFEQVSSDDHQMSLAEDWDKEARAGASGSSVWCVGGRARESQVSCQGDEARARGLCTVRSNTSWIMVTWGTPLWTNRQEWTHYLPGTSLTGGKYTAFITIRKSQSQMRKWWHKQWRLKWNTPQPSVTLSKEWKMSFICSNFMISCTPWRLLIER